MSEVIQFPTMISDQDRSAVFSRVSKARLYKYEVDFWVNDETREGCLTVSPDEAIHDHTASLNAISFFPDPYNRPQWVAVRLGEALAHGRSVEEIIERDGHWLIP